MLVRRVCLCVTDVSRRVPSRSLHSQTTSVMDLLQPPDGSTTTTTTTPMAVSQTAGLGSPSVQISEQSVQDLAGVLSAL